jgi:hypothetical protein
MANESKASNTFLSGIALCIISVLLLVIGAVGVMSTDFVTAIVVPCFFLVVGIFAIMMSKRRNSKTYN